MMKFNDRWKPAEVRALAKMPLDHMSLKHQRVKPTIETECLTTIILILHSMTITDDPLDSTTTILPNEMNRSDS